MSTAAAARRTLRAADPYGSLGCFPEFTLSLFLSSRAKHAAYRSTSSRKLTSGPHVVLVGPKEHALPGCPVRHTAAKPCDTRDPQLNSALRVRVAMRRWHVGRARYELVLNASWRAGFASRQRGHACRCLASAEAFRVKGCQSNRRASMDKAVGHLRGSSSSSRLGAVARCGRTASRIATALGKSRWLMSRTSIFFDGLQAMCPVAHSPVECGRPSSGCATRTTRPALQIVRDAQGGVDERDIRRQRRLARL